MDGDQASRVTPPFRLLTIEDIEQLPPPHWLIANMVLMSSLAVLFGEPNAGKSFLALDWAMSIGSGHDWLGRRVDQGSVIYIAAEGSGGLRQRIAAWKQLHDVRGPINVHFVTEAVQPLDPCHLKHLMTQARQLSDLRLVIFDTFARSAIGCDENSAREVGRFIAEIDRIRLETGAAVLLLHHTGKDASKEARGSTALLGAADTMMRMSDGKLGLALECTKQKDAEKFSTIGLALETVNLSDGLTSCVVREHIIQVFAKGLTETEKKILQALPEAGATSSEWRIAAQVADATFYRALKVYERERLIEHAGLGKGSTYTITAAGRDAITIG